MSGRDAVWTAPSARHGAVTGTPPFIFDVPEPKAGSHTTLRSGAAMTTAGDATSPAVEKPGLTPHIPKSSGTGLGVPAARRAGVE